MILKIACLAVVLIVFISEFISFKNSTNDTIKSLKSEIDELNHKINTMEDDYDDLKYNLNELENRLYQYDDNIPDTANIKKNKKIKH